MEIGRIGKDWLIEIAHRRVVTGDQGPPHIKGRAEIFSNNIQIYSNNIQIYLNNIQMISIRFFSIALHRQESRDEEAEQLKSCFLGIRVFEKGIFRVNSR